ncbi:hypothetical protein DFA_02265 [Cavenderia fasciculata]|uniref:Paramecium surface antigen repeat-containing protein n=1 Tax=Cavenderia fasciculata TaxID=261658 RepID=F4PYZ3_CACFS|nr:uncharacterized protein DFA_02265 [Cavenderia fasciculata]EGG19022.1 hypothetical protein DFA_02265 [Cavenderia fasciculata]|eukprot:XP_004366655.1 hypothetical protein DFA_02265 [Cavenderia fasciculata]
MSRMVNLSRIFINGGIINSKNENLKYNSNNNNFGSRCFRQQQQNNNSNNRKSNSGGIKYFSSPSTIYIILVIAYLIYNIEVVNAAGQCTAEKTCSGLGDSCTADHYYRQTNDTKALTCNRGLYCSQQNVCLQAAMRYEKCSTDPTGTPCFQYLTCRSGGGNNAGDYTCQEYQYGAYNDHCLDDSQCLDGLHCYNLFCKWRVDRCTQDYECDYHRYCNIAPDSSHGNCQVQKDEGHVCNRDGVCKKYTQCVADSNNEKKCTKIFSGGIGENCTHIDTYSTCKMQDNLICDETTFKCVRAPEQTVGDCTGAAVSCKSTETCYCDQLLGTANSTGTCYINPYRGGQQHNICQQAIYALRVCLYSHECKTVNPAPSSCLMAYCAEKHCNMIEACQLNKFGNSNCNIYTDECIQWRITGSASTISKVSLLSLLSLLLLL